MALKENDMIRNNLWIGMFALAVVLAGGCSKAPYYKGQKNTDALRAAVTRDTVALVHVKAETVQWLMGVTCKELEDDEEDLRKAKAFRGFVEDFKLQQIQLTAEVLDTVQPRLLVAATFGKKIGEDDLGALLKKLDWDGKGGDDGEFELSDEFLVKLTGKGKVVYAGERGMVREAAEAYRKGTGRDLPEDATASLRKGDDLYLVILRNDFMEEKYKDIPKPARKMIGALPKSLALTAKLSKGAQLVVSYDDTDEAKEGGEALEAGLGMAKKADLPRGVVRLLKEITVKAKGKVVTATLDAELETPIKDAFRAAKAEGDKVKDAIRCTNNQKLLLLGLMMYANDNEDRFPAGDNWQKVLREKTYVEEDRTFLCPAGKKTYRYFGNGQKASEKDWSRQVLLVCDCDHNGKWVVGFADGHVESLSASRAQELIRASVPAGLSMGGAARSAAKPGDAGFVFKVGLNPTFEPYGFQDSSGEIVGFDVDLAREVARRRGWRIEFRSVAWDAKDTELSSGMINCIWNGFSMNGLEREYTWTEAYVAFSQVLVVRQGSGIAKASDLAGKVVAVQQGSPGAEALNAKTENAALRKSLKAVRQTLDVKTAVEMFQSGSCDAVVLEQNDAARLCQGNAGKYVILPEPLDFKPCGVAFQRGDTALRDAVQATFKDMVRDGTAAKISRKWFDGRSVCIMKP